MGGRGEREREGVEFWEIDVEREKKRERTEENRIEEKE